MANFLLGLVVGMIGMMLLFVWWVTKPAYVREFTASIFDGLAVRSKSIRLIGENQEPVTVPLSNLAEAVRSERWRS
jgi:hypothetical protein